MYVVGSGFFPAETYPEGSNTQASPSQLQDFPLPRPLAEELLRDTVGADLPPDFPQRW